MRYHLRMPIDMNALTRLGAQVRLAELAAEMDSIRRAFQDLGGSRAKKRGRPRRSSKQASVQAPDAIADNPTDTASPQPPKRTMSAEARAKISAAQKKRWRSQKKGKKR